MDVADQRAGHITGQLGDTNRDRFLTRRWNNILTIALGLPTLLFALVALTTDTFSDRATFIGLVALSAFY